MFALPMDIFNEVPGHQILDHLKESFHEVLSIVKGTDVLQPFSEGLGGPFWYNESDGVGGPFWYAELMEIDVFNFKNKLEEIIDSGIGFKPEALAGMFDEIFDKDGIVYNILDNDLTSSIIPGDHRMLSEDMHSDKSMIAVVPKVFVESVKGTVSVLMDLVISKPTEKKTKKKHVTTTTTTTTTTTQKHLPKPKSKRYEHDKNKYYGKHYDWDTEYKYAYH